MMHKLSDLTVRSGFALFWGAWPSNWTESPFTLDGVEYNCVEQFMMAEKARLFNDQEAHRAIMATKEPREQKRLGKGVRNYVDRTWDQVRYSVVVRGVCEKYRQNPNLLRLLLATEDWKFVEASPTDVIWGIGLRKDNPDATDPSKWRGQNLLGKATDEARAILRTQVGVAIPVP